MRELIYLSISILITLWLCVLAVWYVWTMQTEGKIMDSGFALIPDLSDSQFVYMPNVGLAVLFLFFLSIVKDYGTLGKLAVLQCAFSSFRSITVSATLLPNIKVYDFCKERPDSLWETVEYILVRGTCSDYMFSGHTVTAMLLYLFVQKYRKEYWTELLTGIALGLTIFSLLLFRWHYTDDIIIAVVLTWFAFQYYFQHEAKYSDYWFYFPELSRYDFPCARKKKNNLKASNRYSLLKSVKYREPRVF